MNEAEYLMKNYGDRVGCMFRVVQLCKYPPNSRCGPSSCLLAVLAMF